MARPPYFPAFIDLEARPCVVVGGGNVARDKILGLLEAGGAVTVVAPAACGEVQALAEAGSLKWERRTYRAGDLAGAFLVIAATSDSAVNGAVHAESVARSCLVNVVDVPAQCSYITPAIIRRGRLLLAISTQGAAPAFAAVLRRFLERNLGGDIARFLDRAAVWRRRLNLSQGSPAEKRRAWYRMLGPAAPFLLGASPRRGAPEFPGEPRADIGAVSGSRAEPLQNFWVMGSDLAQGSLAQVEAVWRQAEGAAPGAELFRERSAGGSPVFAGLALVAGWDRAEVYCESAHPRLARRAVEHALRGDDPGRRGRAGSFPLYRLRGEAALAHLFAVAAGARAAVPGNMGASGALRRALDEGGLAGTLSPLIEDALRAALALGRRVARELRDGGEGALLTRLFALAHGKIPRFGEARFLVVGDVERQGETCSALRRMGVRREHLLAPQPWDWAAAAQALAASGPVVSAREPERQAPSAARAPLVIIAFAPADSPPLSRPQARQLLAGGGRPVWLLDMGLPRAAEPWAPLHGFVRWDLETIADAGAVVDPVGAEVRRYVEQARSDFMARLTSGRLRP